MNKKLFLLMLFVLSAVADEHPSPIRAAKNNRDVGTTEPLLLVSTLDGVLHAVSKQDGLVKWKLDEDPVLNVPMESTTTIKGPTFLPDPHDGSLYAFDPSSQGLTKLPFTIPELVHASPCKSSDGILYTGRKQDVWYAINPTNGAKEQVITTENAQDKCPGGSSGQMFIGRSEFKVTMFDTKSNLMRWNVTFADYSSHADEKVSADYGLLHLASSADGFVVTVDKHTGRILWAQNYGYPVVAMYAWVPEGLQRVEMTNVAKETMTYLLQKSGGKQSYWDAMLHSTTRYSPKEANLAPSLYVGQYRHSLYALPALTHDGVQINVRKKVQMLPGPTNEESTSTELEIVNPVMPVWQLLGYHNIPPHSKISFPRYYSHPPKRALQIKQESDGNQRTQRDFDLDPVPMNNEEPAEIPPIYDDSTRYTPNAKSAVESPNTEDDSGRIHWNEITIVATLTSIITASAFLCLSRGGWQRRRYNGMVQIGRISFDPSSILGRGSQGTVVYSGTFDGRKVAVKRVVSECFSFAEREVSLLRESDEHAHVIRYFCMERDSQFQYISLELCCNTLQEFVENPQFRCSTGLDVKTVLHQAMLGIDHLHSLKIVHRDVKPTNILISVPGKLARQRVVISDFGLCKKLVPGRLSFSHRSGMAGTDGWIAPEMILGEKYRMTRAVDIFSMGCVFYYVICGKHPFGDAIARQARIINEEYSLDELHSFEDAEEAIDMIRRMLVIDPSKRPHSEVILNHPLFWDSVKILQFFEDVSDRIEKESPDSQVMLHLDRDSLSDITNGIPRDWIQHLCQPLQEDLQKFRSYRAGSVRDLLRAMRNKKHHYRELPDGVKNSLGSIPDQFLKYFASRFPRLLIHTYLSLACCRHEPTFKAYYAQSAHDHLFEENLREQSIFSRAVGNSRTPRKKLGTKSLESSPRVTRNAPSAADTNLDWRSGPVRAEPSHFTTIHGTKNSKYLSKGSFSSLNRLHQSLHNRHDSDGKEKVTIRLRHSTVKRTSESSNSDADVQSAKSFAGSYAQAVSKSLKSDPVPLNGTNRWDVLGSVDREDSDDADSEQQKESSEEVTTANPAPVEEKNNVENVTCDVSGNENAEIDPLEASRISVTLDTTDEIRDCQDTTTNNLVNNADCSQDDDDVADDAASAPSKGKKKRRRRFKKNKSKSNVTDEVDNAPVLRTVEVEVQS